MYLSIVSSDTLPVLHAGYPFFQGRKVIVVITGKDLSTDAEIRMVTEVVSGTDDVNGLKTDRADDVFRQRFLSIITE